MLWLGEKKHLSDVSSWLKWFYGHLRGLRDNLNFLQFCKSLVRVRGYSAGRLNKASKQNLKMQKIQIISKTAQVSVKPF